jgi:hypothetical protein
MLQGFHQQRDNLKKKQYYKLPLKPLHNHKHKTMFNHGTLWCPTPSSVTTHSSRNLHQVSPATAQHWICHSTTTHSPPTSMLPTALAWTRTDENTLTNIPDINHLPTLTVRTKTYHWRQKVASKHVEIINIFNFHVILSCYFNVTKQVSLIHIHNYNMAEGLQINA